MRGAPFDTAKLRSPPPSAVRGSQGNAPSRPAVPPPAIDPATRAGSSPTSIEDYNEAIRLDPQSAANFYNRATAYQRKGDLAAAVADYTDAIRLQPKHAQSHNGLARLLATCADDKLRDGKQAVEHATTACELTEWKFAAFLDTLAAAHAEAGDFEQAVKWAAQSVELATGSRKDEFKARLELYRSGKPFRQQPNK